jgi:glycine hydroxymethyltransferase
MERVNQYLEKTPKEKRRAEIISYLAALDHLSEKSPQIASAITKELEDQRSNLKLIASENYSSLAVQLSMGNLLTDKYAEGFPFHRFYAGCDNIDTIESLAVEEAKKLFGAEGAYVQPHSGADANLVAFWAILVQQIQNKEIEKLSKKSLDELTPEEYEKVRQLLINQKVMGLSLNSGGHLTHGYRHNLSSKMMKAVHYDVDPKTEILDLKQIEEQAKREKPLILLAGYSAYPRKINFAKMREIADSIGAIFMVDMAHFSGLVAGKVFTGDFDPIAHAHIVTSTTHKTLRGPRGGLILMKKEFEEIINKGCPLALGGPLPHVLAAKAIAFQEANTPAFKTYAAKIVENANALAQALMKRGARLVTGGTENHLMVVDVRPFGLTGRQAETILREAGLTLNRNSIPFDPNGPWYTSGIRLGTPAMTTLGMGTSEMDEIADIILSVLKSSKAKFSEKTNAPSKALVDIDPVVLEGAKKRVKSLLSKYPLYPDL